MNLRIGYGIDVHRLEAGRSLIVGGVEIPSTVGAIGHSDADVLLHAICDALLGALNLRDIGHHFSDRDPKYKGIDSTILLKRVMDMLEERGYHVVNIDSTVILEQPKLNPVIETPLLMSISMHCPYAPSQLAVPLLIFEVVSTNV